MNDRRRTRFAHSSQVAVRGPLAGFGYTIAIDIYILTNDATERRARAGAGVVDDPRPDEEHGLPLGTNPTA